MESDARLVAIALGVGFEILEENGHVGRRRLLARVAAREGEIGLQHARHLVDVAAQRLDLRTLADQRKLELEAGQHRAQIVRHAGEHRRALLDGALDAAFHLEKCLGGAAHLARASRPEPGDVAPLAKPLGRVGEGEDWPDLIAQEQDRDAEQHQRRAHHP